MDHSKRRTDSTIHLGIGNWLKCFSFLLVGTSMLVFITSLKFYLHIINRYRNTKAPHLRKNKIHPRHQESHFPIRVFSAIRRFNAMIIICDKCFEVLVMALCIKSKIIKKKVPICTIDTLWFKFDFDSRRWINLMNNK